LKDWLDWNQNKYIDTKIKFVRNYDNQEIVACEYCPTEKMIADLLTKSLTAQRLET